MTGPVQTTVNDVASKKSPLRNERVAVDLEAGDDKEKKAATAEVDYVHRGQWLRAALLGANDGLVSTASLMMGVGAVKQQDSRAMLVSGLAGLVGGACSMAIGEFVSVCSQRDAELVARRITKEEDVVKIGDGGGGDETNGGGDDHHHHQEEHDSKEYQDAKRGGKEEHDERAPKDDHKRGGKEQQVATHGSPSLGRSPMQTTYASPRRASLRSPAHALHAVKAQPPAPSPWEAAGASGLSFAFGAMLPLLSAAFITQPVARMGAIMAVCSMGLACFGAVGASLTSVNVIMGGARVLIGGWTCILVTFCLLKLVGAALT